MSYIEAEYVDIEFAALSGVERHLEREGLSLSLIRLVSNIQT